MGQVLERGRRQRTAVWHLTAGIPGCSRRHAQLRGAPNKRSAGSFASADQHVVDADECGLFHADGYSVPTEDVPTSIDLGSTDSAGVTRRP